MALTLSFFYFADLEGSIPNRLKNFIYFLFIGQLFLCAIKLREFGFECRTFNGQFGP